MLSCFEESHDNDQVTENSCFPFYIKEIGRHLPLGQKQNTSSIKPLIHSLLWMSRDHLVTVNLCGSEPFQCDTASSGGPNTKSPLARELSAFLNSAQQLKQAFLSPAGILPVLQVQRPYLTPGEGPSPAGLPAERSSKNQLLPSPGNEYFLALKGLVSHASCDSKSSQGKEQNDYPGIWSMIYGPDTQPKPLLLLSKTCEANSKRQKHILSFLI